MKIIVKDFFQLGTLRLMARVLMGIRGLLIIASLAPHVLGEYTIWLLFIFYFSMLDFGVLAGLERDIPHFRGLGDTKGTRHHSDVGWSTFYTLMAVASLLLFVVSFAVFKDWLLSALLGAYLLTDKYYRSFDANSRIHLQYRDNGIGELIHAIVSLALIFLLLPKWGPYGILVGFIAAALASSYYLRWRVPVSFTGLFHVRGILQCIKRALPLAGIIYSIQIYHMIALTVLALTTDKETLGYIAFAFRIFQMGLALFPFLIQQVMRTRMYFHVAQAEKGSPYLEKMFYPMGIYSMLTSFFWLITYWWADWGIGLIASQYLPAIGALKILIFALLPLGIAKICSDYLCSNMFLKTRTVIVTWLFGNFLQGAFIYIASLGPNNLMFSVPIMYLVSTILIYIVITKASLAVEGEAFPLNMRMMCLWTPLILALFCVYLLREGFHLGPLHGFSANILPFLISAAGAYVLVRAMMFLFRHSKRFNVFFSYPG